MKTWAGEDFADASLSYRELLVASILATGVEVSPEENCPEDKSVQFSWLSFKC